VFRLALSPCCFAFFSIQLLKNYTYIQNSHLVGPRFVIGLSSSSAYIQVNQCLLWHCANGNSPGNGNSAIKLPWWAWGCFLSVVGSGKCTYPSYLPRTAYFSFHLKQVAEYDGVVTHVLPCPLPKLWCEGFFFFPCTGVWMWVG